MKKLKDIFNSLDPDKKRKAAMGLICGIFIILLFIGYRSRLASNPPEVKSEPPKQRTIDLTAKDEDLALRLSFQNQIKELNEKNADLAKSQQEEIEELKRHIEDMKRGGVPGQPSVGGGQKFGDVELTGVPPSAADGTMGVVPRYAETVSKEAQDRKSPVIVNGGIGSVSIPVRTEESAKREQSKKLVNFIPSGTVLKATLTNGMFAPTMSKGASKPYPAHFRLWDLGFLPNGVRKDLSGCFIMGEAYGELADSRAHIRLSRLSCISNSQKRVLQKDIKGFIVGDDGKVGIFGEIRANFGKIALATLLAEFLSAAGDTVKTASQSVIQNPLGGVTTTYPSTEDIVAAAAGSGFGESAKMIAEFYLEIMKEMSPVIEINGRRDVEIIVDTGIELLTEDFEWEGVKEDDAFDIAGILNSK